MCQIFTLKINLNKYQNKNENECIEVLIYVTKKYQVFHILSRFGLYFKKI